MQQKLRFKRKTYWWWWTPSSWEGWFCTFLFAVGIALVMNHHIDKISKIGDGAIVDGNKILLVFIAQILILVLLMMWVCYKKGEKPKWQRGIKKVDDVSK